MRWSTFRVESIVWEAGLKRMTDSNARLLCAAGCVLCLFLLPRTSLPAPTPRTLERTEDFVVVTGADARALIGAEVKDLRLYSCRAGNCAGIPLQVDKVCSMGRYVFPQEKNSDRDGTRLDQNDEISFMAGDAGDRIPAGWRPEGKARGVEIELIDPLDSGVAWVYLFDLPGAPSAWTGEPFLSKALNSAGAISRARSALA
jgi:hypothetical protein